MKPDRHLRRAFWAVLLLLAVANVVRLSVVPESFGQYGEFRGDHLQEERARDPMIRGTENCAFCHEEQFTLKGTGRHTGLQCEGCHFQPYAGDENHPEAHPEVSQPPNKSQRTCLVCHQYFPARPEFVPQLANFGEHITANAKKIKDKNVGAVNGTTNCVHCHNPHNPKIEIAPNG